MIGRLTGDVQVTCGDCGAVLLIRSEYQVNLQPMKFCPQCGTANLVTHERNSGSIDKYLQADCFAAVDPRLVQMLYSVWATDDKFRQMYPRFVDYLENELLYGEDTSEVGI